MGKNLGDPAEIIRGLRKALAAAQEENRSCRGLRSENARLKDKIKILEKMVKLPKDRDVLPLASSRPSTPDPTGWNPLATPRKLDIGRSMGRSVTVKGNRYVYHDSELIRLGDRLSRISSRPSYMHLTRASEARVHVIESG